MLERRRPQMAEFLRWGDGFANAIFTGLQRLSGIKFTLEFRYEMVV